MHWWPRQTPSTGIVGPTRLTTSVEMPASAGEQGPGEMITCEGASASTSSAVIASCRRTTGSSPSSRT